MAHMDLTGQRYGMLVAIERLGTIGEGRRRKSLWKCRCDCGNITNVTLNDLRTGNTKSCGCNLKKAISEKNKTHGMVGTKFYGVYRAMITRCRNKNSEKYKNYGGRGIKVCGEWDTFEGFYKDMFAGYAEGLSIERIDNNGDYCKNNCKWIPLSEQAKNKTTNHKINVNGVIMNLADACRYYGLNYSTVHNRIYNGWSYEQALGLETRRK